MTDVSWERYDYNNNLGSKPAVITDKDYPKSIFNYIVKADVTNPFWVTNPADNNFAEYALENAMLAEEQYEDVTTAAILKLKYSVTRTALFDATAAGVTAGMKTITGDNYFVWTRNAGTISPVKYIFNAEGLAYIKGLTNTSDPLYTGYPELVELHNFLVTESVALEDAAMFGTNYARNDYTQSVQYVKGSNGLAYHMGAVSYYRVLIRHFDNTLQPTPMAWGRYGVVRNNVYVLTLTSVMSPGDIDIPEPKGPDDKEGFLAVEIKVLPWTVRNQNVDI